MGLDAMNPSSWDDEFTKQGLFIDDVYQLRILDPVVADQTLNLKKECDHFLTTTRRFDNLVESFKVEASKMASTVENEKRRAIGYRLMLDALRKNKQEDQRRLTALVEQRRMEMEHLKIELEMYHKADQFHQEMLDQFQLFQYLVNNNCNNCCS